MSVLPLVLAAALQAVPDAPMPATIAPATIAPARIAPAPDASPRAAAPMPPCSGEVCQPRVAVPGRDPVGSWRGRRTDYVLDLLGRARVEPVARTARFLSQTGLRVDYAPPRADAASAADRGHWGRLQLGLRFRLDALNRPALAGVPGR